MPPETDATNDFKLAIERIADELERLELEIPGSLLEPTQEEARDHLAEVALGVTTPAVVLLIALVLLPGQVGVAFLIGTAAAGLAGGLYAYLTQLVVPDTFGFVQSVTILAMVVIGGIGSTWGVVVGAILLTLMPELFRFINDYKLLVYGALLLLVMRFSPGGIAGWVARLTHRSVKT